MRIKRANALGTYAETNFDQLRVNARTAIGRTRAVKDRLNTIAEHPILGRQFRAATYITALTIDFFTVVFGFLTALDVIALDVVMQHEGTCRSDRRRTSGRGVTSLDPVIAMES